jgi:ketosteroid isomerase-like protein
MSENEQRHFDSMRDWNEGGMRGLSDNWWADDLEWHDQPNLPDPRVVHGRKQVEAHIDELIAAIGYFKFRVKRAEEIVENVTVAEVELIGEGAPRSGVEFIGSVHQVVHWRDGLKTKISTFADRESALSDARSAPARSRASARGL